MACWVNDDDETFMVPFALNLSLLISFVCKTPLMCVMGKGKSYGFVGK